MKHFTKNDIKDAFDSTYYYRGLAYFKQGAVLSIEVINESEDDTALETEVKGSGYKPYAQAIKIQKHGSGIQVHAFCSCPVGYNCKHVVAGCIAYQERQGREDQDTAAALAWLDQFAYAFAEKPARDTNQNFLVYVLSKNTYANELSLVFHATKALKRGGLGKGKEVNFSSVMDAVHTMPAYMQETDAEIVRLLQADENRYSYLCRLRGEMGFAAVKKILATGRCFWDDFHGEPLAWGEDRQLTQAWDYDEAGNAKLRLEVSPEAFVLPTEPVLYVDGASQQVGILENADYNYKQLSMLQNAPAVPAALVESFSQKAALTIPNTRLTPPKSVETKLISGELPIGQMVLMYQELGGKTWRMGRIRMLYADVALPALPFEKVSTIMQEGSLYSVERSEMDELLHMSTLVDYGFGGGLISGEKDTFCNFCCDNPMQEDAQWADFISTTMPELQAAGWQITIADDFNMQIHEAGDWHADIEEQDNDWFDLRFDVDINGKKQPLLPLIAQVLKHYEPESLPNMLTLNMGDGQFLKIASELVKPVLDILYELYDSQSLSESGALTMSRFDAGRLAELDNSNLQWRGGDNLREIGKQLQDFEGIQAVQPPQGLHAELRNYQQQGLNWLQFLRRYQFNGILADDMGLGKTVQTLAHLLCEKEQGRLDKPCLIIAPTSLMSNWRREAEVFAPALKVLVLQGSERKQHFENIQAYDVILSTYPLLVRDEEVLKQHTYHLLVLDEAQVVKNHKAKAARVIREIKAGHKLCLTGTPMENHLGELWALFDFLMPGFLGDSKQFNNVFRTPIEKHGSAEQQQRLVQRIKPFMLRRSKSEVLAELPAKTEITRTVSFGKKQAALYESIRISMEKKVRETIASKGLSRSHITILDALLKLRQVCCDPRILSLKQAQKLEESAKLELLMEMLPEMIAEGRRILLFSQFTKMLALIEGELKSHKIKYSKLTGQTRKRDDVIEKFKSGAADVFLISLKAGGVGLNLTEADTVIHYDPWWNPAAENQATDRAHRIGQDKAVFVYKLVVENSLEEKIVQMQAKKQALADAVYEKGKKKDGLQITADDMQALFAPL